MTTFRLPLDEPQPTQPYLSGAKLAAVVERFDFDDPAYVRLPVFEFRDGEWHLTDGHTRAFVAYLAGVEELRVEPERPAFREAYDLDSYRECIRRCEAAGVTSVPDLAGRVLSHDRFEECWIER